jgi:cell filamentation protein
VDHRSADPYTYPGTSTLGNRLQIRDPEALKKFEYRRSAHRINQLREQPIQGKFDLEHLKAIHKHIFQDVYEWAGQTRVVNLSKGTSSFARAEFIESEAARLTRDLAKEKHLRGLEKPDFVERLVHYQSELNALHPFREGNGRSTREFMAQLAKEAGYELDQERIDNSKDRWNHASQRSMVGDLSELKAIFSEAIRPSRAIAFEVLPEDLATARFPELRVAYDNLDSVRKSLAKQYPDNEKARSHFAQQTRAEIMRKLDSGKLPTPAKDIARAAADRPADTPARARAFQAVADNKLTREDALRFFPELRPAFNALSVAKVRGDVAELQQLRTTLQNRLNAGEVPQPASAAPQRSVKHELQR